MKTRGFEVVIGEKRKTMGEIALPTRGSSTAMAYDFYANNDYILIWYIQMFYLSIFLVLYLDII